MNTASEGKTSKGQRTKDALADALEQLVTEMPISKIHVRTVTDRAGVDRQTFYYHFDTMGDAALYVYHRRADDLLKALPNCADARELFATVGESVERNKVTLRELLREVGRPVLRELLRDDATTVLRAQARRICAQREVRLRDEEIDFAVEYCLMASASMFVDWLEGRIGGSTAQLAERLARAFEQHIEGLL